MLTTGSAIGAGMFSLPIISSGMWWWYSVGCLFFLWVLNYLAALYLLEVNLRFPRGASFDTLATKILGPTWNMLIGLSVAFLMYILLYAYFSAFGNMATQILQWDIVTANAWGQGILSLVLGCLLGGIVWWSTAAVGRISTILVGGMVFTFMLSMGGFALQVEPEKLFDQTNNTAGYFSYVWAALPYYMTSLGYATLVPSLYKFYGKNVRRIKGSLLGGSLLAASVYLLFLLVTFGNIDRQEFIIINKAGGNIGHFVSAFEKGQANAHKGIGWEKFTDAVIIQISERLNGVIFVLWGAPAQKKTKLIDTAKHHVLCAPHPSPLSAHRGFLGCGHFSEINRILHAHQKSEIDWHIPN